MLKSNLKNILDLKYIDNTPLLSSNSKGKKNKLRIKKKKEKIRLKRIKDINGMQITYDVIKKN